MKAWKDYAVRLALKFLKDKPARSYWVVIAWNGTIKKDGIPEMTIGG